MSLPVIEWHCRDCDKFDKAERKCKKYNMLTEPYQTCKSCTVYKK